MKYFSLPHCQVWYNKNAINYNFIVTIVTDSKRLITVWLMTHNMKYCWITCYTSISHLESTNELL